MESMTIPDIAVQISLVAVEGTWRQDPTRERELIRLIGLLRTALNSAGDSKGADKVAWILDWHSKGCPCIA